MPLVLQTESEDLDHSFDWSDYLDDQGSPSDTISTSAWAITPDVGSPSPSVHTASIAGTVTTAFLKELTAGEVFQLTNTITTAGGRTGQKTVTIRCEWLR